MGNVKNPRMGNGKNGKNYLNEVGGLVCHMMQSSNSHLLIVIKVHIDFTGWLFRCWLF